jgi:hypothetical protein
VVLLFELYDTQFLDLTPNIVIPLVTLVAWFMFPLFKGHQDHHGFQKKDAWIVIGG